MSITTKERYPHNELGVHRSDVCLGELDPGVYLAGTGSTGASKCTGRCAGHLIMHR